MSRDRVQVQGCSQLRSVKRFYNRQQSPHVAGRHCKMAPGAVRHAAVRADLSTTYRKQKPREILFRGAFRYQATHTEISVRVIRDWVQSA